MSDTIQLKVITPLELVLDEQVDELVAPGELGEFGVLPGHVPFVSTLLPGELKYISGSNTKTLIIDGGLADVKNDVVNILTDSAQSPSDIDVVAAKKELEELEKELADLEEEADSDKTDLQRKIRLAQAKAGVR